MEDLYFLEFHALKVKYRCKEVLKDQDPKLTVNIDFGPVVSFEINQDEFANDLLTDEQIKELEEENRFKKVSLQCESLLSTEEDKEAYKRYAELMSKLEIDMDCGASILFSQNPEGLKQSFQLFPLHISVWADVKQARRECVGVTKHIWSETIINSIDQANMCCYNIDPTTVKITEPLKSEITGSVIGEVTMLIRISCLGKASVTLYKECCQGNGFIFRNRTLNKSYKCKSHGLDAVPQDLIPVGVFYETLEIQDPDDVAIEHRKSQVTKELREAGLDEECVMFVTGDKGRNEFGCCNIPFPCGNPECTLIKMIKDYLKQPCNYAITDKVEKEGANVGIMSGPGKSAVKGSCPPSQPKGPCNFKVPSTSQVKCPMEMTPCSCEPIAANPCTAPCAAPPDHSKCGVCQGPCSGAKREDESELERLVYEGLTKMLFANKKDEKKCC